MPIDEGERGLRPLVAQGSEDADQQRATATYDQRPLAARQQLSQFLANDGTVGADIRVADDAAGEVALGVGDLDGPIAQVRQAEAGYQAGVAQGSGHPFYAGEPAGTIQGSADKEGKAGLGQRRGLSAFL